MQCERCLGLGYIVGLGGLKHACDHKPLESGVIKSKKGFSSVTGISRGGSIPVSVIDEVMDTHGVTRSVAKKMLDNEKAKK